MTTLTPADVASLESSANAFLATKYLAATSLVCILYDHLLTLDDEISVIWTNRCPMVTKLVYCLSRYAMEGFLIYASYNFAVLRKLIGQEDCRVLTGVILTAVVVWSFMANMYLAFRLYGIWDQRRSAIKIIIGSFVVCYAPVVVLAVLAVQEYVRIVQVIPVPQFNVCFVPKQSNALIGMWSCSTAFDIVVIGHALANSLDRPRRQNSDLLKSLRRDGAIFFVALAVLRFTNLIMNILLPPKDIWAIGVLLWAAITLTLARLILGVELLKGPRGSIHTWRPALNSFEMDHWSSGTISDS